MCKLSSAEHRGYPGHLQCVCVHVCVCAHTHLIHSLGESSAGQGGVLVPELRSTPHILNSLNGSVLIKSLPPSRWLTYLREKTVMGCDNIQAMFPHIRRHMGIWCESVAVHEVLNYSHWIGDGH